MQCPKPDCMYLHELGDEAASFTKEEMQVSDLCSSDWSMHKLNDILKLILLVYILFFRLGNIKSMNKNCSKTFTKRTLTFYKPQHVGRSQRANPTPLRGVAFNLEFHRCTHRE